MSLEKTSMIVIAGLVGVAGMVVVTYTVVSHGRKDQESMTGASYTGTLAVASNKLVLGEQTSLRPGAVAAAASLEASKTEQEQEPLVPASSVDSLSDPASRQ